LKPWSDVVTLGKTIVRDLGLEESNDTLGRWMAHRLAELMREAEVGQGEKARDAGRKAASDLVLRIWDHRSSWPLGWPPPNAAKILEELDPPPYRERRAHTGSPWLDSLAELDQLHRRERRIWANAALLDFDFNAERRVVAETREGLRDDERETLEALTRERDRAAAEILEVLAVPELPASGTDRATAAMAQLAEIDEERRQLLVDVKASIRLHGDNRAKTRPPARSRGSTSRRVAKRGPAPRRTPRGSTERS
jgi:hypothetical protein